MSRNFDLLAELERERDFRPGSGHARVASETPAAQVASSEQVAERPEILHLVRSIYLLNKENAPRQLVFVGVDGEGASSTICAQAGRTLAAVTGKPVCLIDGDVRGARLSRILGADRTVPISAKFSPAKDQCTQIGTNVWLAGADFLKDNHGLLLPIDELKSFMAQLESSFEYLLIDAPGATISDDAQALGQAAEAAVLVIEANKTRRTIAAKAKDQLEEAGVKLLGTVLNDRSFPIPEKVYKWL